MTAKERIIGAIVIIGVIVAIASPFVAYVLWAVSL